MVRTRPAHHDRRSRRAALRLSRQAAAVAVSSATRLSSGPKLPTIAEAGLPGFEASQWYGIVAPAGTPDLIMRRLSDELRRALAAPDVVAKLANEGAEPWPTSPEEFHGFIVGDIARWGQLIRDNGIQVR